MEASPTIPSALPASTVKAARISGKMVNLHALAAAYRLSALAVLGSFATLCLTLFLLARGMTSLGLTVFTISQLATGAAIGCAAHRSAAGAAAVEQPPRTLSLLHLAGSTFFAALCCIPILGLLPAADLCGKAHRIFNTLGVPVGMLGPSQAALASLRLGVCHQCGYDISKQPGNTCPECGNDVAGDKADATGSLGPVQVDTQAATSCATACTVMVTIGLLIGVPQAFLFVFAASNLRDHLLWLWLPGPIWGLVASVLASRALRILAARGTVDHAVVLLSSLLCPAFGAIILAKLASRLSRAAQTGTAE